MIEWGRRSTHLEMCSGPTELVEVMVARVPCHFRVPPGAADQGPRDRRASRQEIIQNCVTTVVNLHSCKAVLEIIGALHRGIEMWRCAPHRSIGRPIFWDLDLCLGCIRWVTHMV